MKRTDAEEFTSYVEARMDRLRRTAYLLSRDWHTADDLVSIMVSKVFRHWRKISQVENVDAYAQRMLTRTWLDETRRPWPQGTRDRMAARWRPRPFISRRRPRSPVAVARLTRQRQRAVVVLRFYLDLTVEETADILGITPGTVKSQSARGLENLRALAEGWAR